MNKRDPKADLEMIDTFDQCFSEQTDDFVRDVVLPHALRRAIAAEAEVDQLRHFIADACCAECACRVGEGWAWVGGDLLCERCGDDNQEVKNHETN